jgi:hypothetical protein
MDLKLRTGLRISVSLGLLVITAVGIWRVGPTLGRMFVMTVGFCLFGGGTASILLRGRFRRIAPHMEKQLRPSLGYAAPAWAQDVIMGLLAFAGIGVLAWGALAPGFSN